MRYTGSVRVLIIADIHGNLEALQAVLNDAQRDGALDEVWCLGDMVGYGPDPGACLGLLASLPLVAVAGNHDLAAVGSIGLEAFNPEAAEAARWTASRLTKQQAALLKGLPGQVERPPFTLVHGSPLDPVWDYVLPQYMTPDQLVRAFGAIRTPYCLVGQSHVPLVCWEEGLRFARLEEGRVVELGAHRLMVNPGSVGQPRDGDPRASYLVYHEESKRLLARRVVYDIAATQAKMLRAGLPARLATRLSYGA